MIVLVDSCVVGVEKTYAYILFLFQTVEMKVRIDGEGCERKIKKALEDMKGA